MLVDGGSKVIDFELIRELIGIKSKEMTLACLLN